MAGRACNLRLMQEGVSSCHWIQNKFELSLIPGDLVSNKTKQNTKSLCTPQRLSEDNLAGVGTLLLSSPSKNRNQVVQLSSKLLYTLPHPGF